MRFLLRNAIFILFPSAMVAIIFLANMSFGTAVRFGEWGERSIAESMLIVNNEKIERAEAIIRNTDDSFFRIIDPAHIDLSCDRWRRAVSVSRLVEAAAVIDDYGGVAAFFYLEGAPDHVGYLRDLIEKKVVPLLDKYESLDQYKHLHQKIGDEYRLITHYTTVFRDEDYTAVLLYNTDEIVEGLLSNMLSNVGEERVANVVDDRNELILGNSIGGSGQFIVSKSFPTTLYKWRLQLAPTEDALFNSEAKARAQRFSRLLLIPLALGIVVLGLVALYTSVVRERRLSRLKSDFIANVSHELRTPLSLIKMFGELLLMGKAQDKERTARYAEVILRETDRLASLVDNVLDLSNIEQGKASYCFDSIDILEVVGRTVEIFRHRLEMLGIVLDYKAEPGVLMARADEHAITLAMVNLLDNALKYAKGTDIIGVEISSQDRFISIDVYDHGPGIPSSQIKRIFDRFYRVSTPESQKQRGSGIGLSLVKHIIDSHKGEIRVTSDPSIETRFSIRIPKADI